MRSSPLGQERSHGTCHVWPGQRVHRADAGRHIGSVGAHRTPERSSRPASPSGTSRRRSAWSSPEGTARHYHQAFHDPCKARAVVFDDGKTRVAIVGIDALFIRRQTVQAVRSAIQKRCGIEPGSILISASHTHSGGPIGYYLPGEFDDASPLVRSLVYDRTVCANPEYLAKVEQAIVEAVCAADARRTAARCGLGFGLEDKVAFNRRFRMKDGFAMTHPGQGNPAIIEPAGPTDPQVGVLGVWNPEGQFLGCIVNFACHATTGPGGISADYIYYLEKTIRGIMGDQAVVVFLPGAAGDITQVDNRSPYQIKQFGEVSARFVGGTRRRRGGEGLAGDGARAGTEPLGPLAAESRLLQDQAATAAGAEHLARALEIVKKNPEDGRCHGMDLRQGDRGPRCPDRPGAGRGGRGAGGAGWAGRVPGLSRGVLLPVRPGPEGPQQVPLHLPGLAGQRRDRLRAHRGSTRPARAAATRRA